MSIVPAHTDRADQANRVMILMAVYNGADTLVQQIDSLCQQSFESWDLTVSDDGSSDGSPALIAAQTNALASAGHALHLRHGPRQGFAENFLDLLASLPPDTGPVAMADQDDVWLPDKLERAVAHLTKIPPEQPALYCSRRYIWTPQRAGHGPVSRNYPRPPGFSNALIENIAPGNTIVLNAAAAQLARAAAGQRPAGIFAHDWWLYLVLSGMGGTVLFDPTPTLLYRQHARNALGAGERIARRFANKVAVLRGSFAQRVGTNLEALVPLEADLTPLNRTRLELFQRARTAPLLRRLTLLRQAGVYRQGRLSGLSFWAAACLGLV